jgi:hypothetical protein
MVFNHSVFVKPLARNAASLALSNRVRIGIHTNVYPPAIHTGSKRTYFGKLKAQNVDIKIIPRINTNKASVLAHSKRKFVPPSLAKLDAILASAQSGFTIAET